MSGPYSEEIAAAAARMVVEDGMEYGPAKRRAAKRLGLHPRDADLPDNDQLEDEVRAYLALFCAETQPRELAALRGVAHAVDGAAGSLSGRISPARSGAAPRRGTATSTWSSTATIRRPPSSR